MSAFEALIDRIARRAIVFRFAQGDFEWLAMVRTSASLEALRFVRTVDQQRKAEIADYLGNPG